MRRKSWDQDKRAQSRNLETLDYIVDGHITDRDFLGTLRDLQGNPVPKPEVSSRNEGFICWLG